MKKIICLILIGVACLMPTRIKGVNADIYDIMTNCKKVEVTINNENFVYDKEDKEYDEILDEINEMLIGSHEMPAFGVSIDKDTKEAKKIGVWVELKYDKVYSHNEMPFDSLLIQVEKNWNGFNIYRGNNGIYEGRCFYINLLDNNMDDLYNLLISFPQN